jgi:hypothetical protein
MTFVSGTDAANQALKLFANMPSDYRVYAASGYNAILSDANVAALKTFMETRHSRSY